MSFHFIDGEAEAERGEVLAEAEQGQDWSPGGLPPALEL